MILHASLVSAYANSLIIVDEKLKRNSVNGYFLLKVDTEKRVVSTAHFEKNSEQVAK